MARKKTAKLRLVEVLAGSLLMHLVAGFILATVMIIVDHGPEDPPDFKLPPQQEPRIPVKPPEFTKPTNPAESASPKNTPITVPTLTEITIPTPEFNVEAMSPGEVTIKGFGDGRVPGDHNFDNGISPPGLPITDIFDINIKGERIVVVLEASNLMLLDKRGGYEAFGLIKDELKNVLASIPAGTLFNLVVYTTGAPDGDYNCTVSAYSNRLVPVTPMMVEDMMAWVEPLHKTGYDLENFDNRYYTFRDRFNPIGEDATGWFAGVHAAMEMRADAIVVINTGWNGIQPKFETDEEELVFLENEHDWDAKDERRWKELVSKAIEWANKTQPGRVWESDWQRVKEFDAQARLRPQNFYSPKTITKWAEEMGKRYYPGLRPPSVNVALFSGLDEPSEYWTMIDGKYERFARGELIRSFVKAFRGKFKEIVGLEGIQRVVSPPQSNQSLSKL